jgi:hypothetical protein
MPPESRNARKWCFPLRAPASNSALEQSINVVPLREIKSVAQFFSKRVADQSTCKTTASMRIIKTDELCELNRGEIPWSLILTKITADISKIMRRSAHGGSVMSPHGYIPLNLPILQLWEQ